MKKKFLSFVFSLFLILPMAFIIGGCNEDPKVTGLQVLYNGEDVTEDGKTITIDVDDTLDLSSDIIVKLVYDNNTTKEIEEKSDTTDGYMIIGEPETLEAGTFDVFIKYAELDAVKVTVLVEKLDNSLTFGNMNKVYDGEPVTPIFETEGLAEIEWWKKGEAGQLDVLLGSAPINAGHYYLKIITESPTYKTVSGVKDVIISKAEAEMPEIPELHVGVTGITLGDLELPTGFEWNNSAIEIDSFGAKTYKAKYTPTDAINYAPIENIDILVIVYNGEMSAVYGDTLEDVELTEGFSWKTPSTKLNAVGSFEHICQYTFTPSGSTTPVTREFNVVVVVGKAKPVFTAPSFLGYVGMKLSDISLAGTGFEWKNPEELITATKSKYQAIYTPEDTTNYEIVETEITINVGEVQEIPLPIIIGTYTYTGTTLNVEIDIDEEYLDKVVIAGSTAINAGDYELRVSIKDEFKGGYIWEDGTRETKSLYYTVEKATPSYQLPTDITGLAGQKLSEITLPSGFTWKNANELLTTTKNTYKAIFDLNKRNYKTVEVDITVAVSKADPTYILPTDLTVYVGQKLSDITLPERFAWVNANTVMDTAGEQIFQATYTPEDTNNYNVVEVQITVRVVAIEQLSIPTVSGTYTYNGTEQTIVFANYDNEKITITENKQTNAGTYQAKVNIKNEFKNSYAWSDGTTDEKIIEYTIDQFMITLSAKEDYNSFSKSFDNSYYTNNGVNEFICLADDPTPENEEMLPFNYNAGDFVLGEDFYLSPVMTNVKNNRLKLFTDATGTQPANQVGDAYAILEYTLSDNSINNNFKLASETVKIAYQTTINDMIIYSDEIKTNTIVARQTLADVSVTNSPYYIIYYANPEDTYGEMEPRITVLGTWSWSDESIVMPDEESEIRAQLTFTFDRVVYGEGADDFIDLSSREAETRDVIVYKTVIENITSTVTYQSNGETVFENQTITRTEDLFEYNIESAESGILTYTFARVPSHPQLNIESNEDYWVNRQNYDDSTQTYVVEIYHNQCYGQEINFSIYVGNGVNKTLSVKTNITNPYITLFVNEEEWDGVTPLKQGDRITCTLKEPEVYCVKMEGLGRIEEGYVISYTTGNSLDIECYTYVDGYNDIFITGFNIEIADYKLPFDTLTIDETTYDVESDTEYKNYKLAENQEFITIEFGEFNYEDVSIKYYINDNSNEMIQLDGNKIENLPTENLQTITIEVYYQGTKVVYRSTITVQQYSIIEAVRFNYYNVDQCENVECLYEYLDEDISLNGLINSIDVSVKEGYTYTCDFDVTDQKDNQIVTINVFDQDDNTTPVLTKSFNLNLRLGVNAFNQEHMINQEISEDFIALTEDYEWIIGINSGDVDLVVYDNATPVQDNTITVQVVKTYTVEVSYEDAKYTKTVTVIPQVQDYDLSTYINVSTPCESGDVRIQLESSRSIYQMYLGAGDFIDSMIVDIKNALESNLTDLTNKVNLTKQGNMITAQVTNSSDQELINVYIILIISGEVNNVTDYVLAIGDPFSEELTPINIEEVDGVLNITDLQMLDMIGIGTVNEFAYIEIYTNPTEGESELVFQSRSGAYVMYNGDASYTVYIYPTDGSEPRKIVMNLSGIYENALEMTIGSETYTAKMDLTSSGLGGVVSNFFQDVIIGIEEGGSYGPEVDSIIAGYLGKDAILEDQTTFTIDSLSTLSRFKFFDLTGQEIDVTGGLTLDINTDKFGNKFVAFRVGASNETASVVALIFNNDAYQYNFSIDVNGQIKKFGIERFVVDIITETIDIQARGEDFQLFNSDGFPVLGTIINVTGTEMPETIDMKITFEDDSYFLTDMSGQNVIAQYDTTSPETMEGTKIATLSDMPVTDGMVVALINGIEWLPVVIMINLVEPTE